MSSLLVVIISFTTWFWRLYAPNPKYEKRSDVFYFFWMSFKLGYNDSFAAEHGLKDRRMITLWGVGYKHSIVMLFSDILLWGIRILKIKRVEDVYLQLTTNMWKHLLSKTTSKYQRNVWDNGYQYFNNIGSSQENLQGEEAQ